VVLVESRAQINYGLLSAFYVMSTPSRERYQEGFQASLVSIVPVSILLSLPVVYVLARNSIALASPPKLCLFAPAIIAIADTVIVWMLASTLYGTLAGGPP